MNKRIMFLTVSILITLGILQTELKAAKPTYSAGSQFGQVIDSVLSNNTYQTPFVNTIDAITAPNNNLSLSDKLSKVESIDLDYGQLQACPSYNILSAYRRPQLPSQLLEAFDFILNSITNITQNIENDLENITEDHSEEIKSSFDQLKITFIKFAALFLPLKPDYSVLILNNNRMPLYNSNKDVVERYNQILTQIDDARETLIVINRDTLAATPERSEPVVSNNNNNNNDNNALRNPTIPQNINPIAQPTPTQVEQRPLSPAPIAATVPVMTPVITPEIPAVQAATQTSDSQATQPTPTQAEQKPSVSEPIAASVPAIVPVITPEAPVVQATLSASEVAQTISKSIPTQITQQQINNDNLKPVIDELSQKIANQNFSREDQTGLIKKTEGKVVSEISKDPVAQVTNQEVNVGKQEEEPTKKDANQQQPLAVVQANNENVQTTSTAGSYLKAAAEIVAGVAAIGLTVKAVCDTFTKPDAPVVATNLTDESKPEPKAQPQQLVEQVQVNQENLKPVASEMPNQTTATQMEPKKDIKETELKKETCPNSDVSSECKAIIPCPSINVVNDTTKNTLPQTSIEQLPWLNDERKAIVPYTQTDSPKEIQNNLAEQTQIDQAPVTAENSIESEKETSDVAGADVNNNNSNQTSRAAQFDRIKKEIKHTLKNRINQKRIEAAIIDFGSAIEKFNNQPKKQAELLNDLIEQLKTFKLNVKALEELLRIVDIHVTSKITNENNKKNFTEELKTLTPIQEITRAPEQQERTKTHLESTQEALTTVKETETHSKSDVSPECKAIIAYQPKEITVQLDVAKKAFPQTSIDQQLLWLLNNECKTIVPYKHTDAPKISTPITSDHSQNVGKEEQIESIINTENEEELAALAEILASSSQANQDDDIILLDDEDEDSSSQQNHSDPGVCKNNSNDKKKQAELLAEDSLKQLINCLITHPENQQIIQTIIELLKKEKIAVTEQNIIDVLTGILMDNQLKLNKKENDQLIQQLEASLSTPNPSKLQ